MRGVFGGRLAQLIGLAAGLFLFLVAGLLIAEQGEVGAISASQSGPGVSFSITIGDPSFYFNLSIQDPDTKVAHALFLGCMAAFFGMDSHMILELGGTTQPEPPGGILSLLYRKPRAKAPEFIPGMKLQLLPSDGVHGII